MVQPRNAATVVLLRPDESDGFDLLLTRRPESMRFLGGFYVFPGGTVHRDDYSARTLARCRQLSGEAARTTLGGQHDAEVALGHWVAVVRELFEEVGVLLCAADSGEPVELHDQAVQMRLEQKRQAIVKRQLEFGEFLESENLFCDLSQVAYFDHWVTPAIYSMRFDTRFYAAVLPPGQMPLKRSEEVTHSLWIKPGEALSRMNRSDFPILPPTTTVLSEFSRIPSWAELQRRFALGRGGANR